MSMTLPSQRVVDTERPSVTGLRDGSQRSFRSEIGGFSYAHNGQATSQATTSILVRGGRVGASPTEDGSTGTLAAARNLQWRLQEKASTEGLGVSGPLIQPIQRLLPSTMKRLAEDSRAAIGDRSVVR
mgnify:CR=1 FL=1